MAKKAAAAPAEEELPVTQALLLKLEEKLNTELVEREREIRVMILALVARQHAFLMGSPGVAKSLQFNRLLDHIEDADKFAILLSRFTTPEEVFGPQSLASMKQDRYERKIDSYLPTADIAFVDEIFKANSSILNSLLQAINERTYRHGTNMIDIPLSSLFCASNELPQDESLNALYDRLLFRLVVHELNDSASIVQMLNTSHEPNPDPILSWSEVKQAQDEAAAVVVPQRVIEAIATIQRELRGINISVSGRRLHESLKVVRAAAWLDGEAEADLEHLRPLQHVFWENPTQQDEVQRIVASVASPLDMEALALLDELMSVRKQADQLTDEQRKGDKDAQAVRKESIALFNDTDRFETAYTELQERHNKRRRPSEPLADCKRQLRHLTAFFKEQFKTDSLPDNFGASSAS